jgi:radical SAM superfamily enzyme YgiQ (UPF0313 family)
MLSSLYVAAAMPRCVDTTIVDEEVESIDFQADADLVGVSFMTFNAPRAYEIADKFRSKGKRVLAGGYHPSFLPEEALQHFDAVCVGEAENVAPRIIDDLLCGTLGGIYHADYAPLTGLPIPDRTLIRRSSYSVVDAVQATRGCPHQCTFCSISSFFKKSVRVRPVREVVDELGQLGRHVLFMDDNITADPEYAEELFTEMIPLKKRWFSQCSTTVAHNNRLLDLAAQSGCRGLFIGFESLSQDGLRGWHKTFNRVKDYQRVVAKIHERGIAVQAAIVLGNDLDTNDIFPRTLEFLLQANLDALQATILTPFPGTPLYTEMEAAGRIIDRDWGHYDFRHVVFEPALLSRGDLLQGHDWVLQQFYSRISIKNRFLRELRYLQPSTMLRTTIPLNLSYRSRLAMDGTIRQ